MLKLRAPKKIAVTGGIAAGKSTVCRLFEEFGAFVLSSDEIVHKLLDPSTILGKKVIKLLGEDIVVGACISRRRVAQKVFSDSPVLLNELEKLIHPEVQRVIETKYEAVVQLNKYLFFVVEIPLLFESGQERYYDKIIVIASDEEKCRKRFHFDAKQYKLRSQRLMPIEKKIEQADFVIENNGTLENLRQTIQTIIISLKETL